MRHRLLTIVLGALLYVSLAASAAAQYLYLNDPNQTPGVATDYIVISQDNVGASYTSAEFDLLTSYARGYNYMLVIFTVADCQASCNHQVQTQAQAPDGTWFLWGAPTALTSNTTTRHLYGLGLVAGSDAADITSYNGRGLPPRLRFRVVRAGGSGTVDPTVQVMLW